jgi:hypothetical protein
MFSEMLLSFLMYQLENKSNIFIFDTYNILISIVREAPVGVIFLPKIYV